MPLLFKSTLSSATTNATFVDKTIDDKTVNVLGLEKPDFASSGDIITNAQLKINQNSEKSIDSLTLNNGDNIGLSLNSGNFYIRVQGDGAPVIMNALPFTNTKLADDRAKLKIVGMSDTDTVTFTLNDVQFGLYINDDATLKRGYILNLIYDDTLERYIEEGRNF